MRYVALQRLKVGDGYIEPGQLLPEGEEWDARTVYSLLDVGRIAVVEPNPPVARTPTPTPTPAPAPSPAPGPGPAPTPAPAPGPVPPASKAKTTTVKPRQRKKKSTAGVS